ncbi:hypothetical protein [Hyperthermus butylicus]|uniref:Uncharacterized protein n=1 Tax=Hyperthermus butylicus (strain DSM 5456 / JCM 9403 / PLM1-5) TaxID=415426 RepID=A2BLG1_HYPBU|nr:hypothetical protein [Hyperthermus butylicus]ABM80822.1 hypothetical protein Hbut_0974 [Hyperthermus butylicus DSM 5456]
MAVKKYTCVVCGRVFPEGQGIIIRRANVELTFHSKSCLARFFRLFVERLDEREFRRAAMDVVKEFEELRKARAPSKKI